MTEKRFIVSNGELMEYNYFIDAWHEADLEKVCTILNEFDEISHKVLKNMWKEIDKK